MSKISDQLELTLKREILARRTFKQKVLERIYNKRSNIIIFTLLFIILCIFIVAALLRNDGMFTVTVPREDMISLGLVLSEEPDFKFPMQELRSPPVIKMWNITETDLPANINNVNGSHNGKNYLAYTFYIKNIGDKTVFYNANMNIMDMYLAVDEAMRVKIYINDKPELLAKKAKNGKPEPGTKSFVSESRIARYTDRELAPNQMEKYTIVVWLEGEDPECVNSILGGFIKLKLNFDGYAKLDKTQV